MTVENRRPRGRAYWIRTIAYWVFTVVVANEMIAGSMWDLLKIEYVRTVFAHLGYPIYVLSIIGAWKLPCGVVWLLPRFPRLKEWAYAGAVFNYSGAVASHLFAGDGPKIWVGPLMFALLAVASWALRPPQRKLVATPTPQPRSSEWLITSAVAALMLIVAVLTLPKGPTPF